MIRRLLIANRGEIAVRVLVTCKRMGIETVLAVSEADKNSLAGRLADQVVVIGPSNAALSYLHVPAIVTAAMATDCDAVHPGYGFLSEGTELASALEEQGIVFVGPSVDVLARAGNKLKTREVAEAAGISVMSGSPALESVDEAVAHATRLEYPVLLKAAAGGGGRGMTVCRDSAEVRQKFVRASTEAQAAFGDGRLFVERFAENARHVEVQIVGDRHGNVIHLGDRDCSVQRRHQKLIEEAPASSIDGDLRAAMLRDAVELGRALGYDSVGTVEFLVDLDRSDHSLLEVNARIQVEHGVTEMISGVDLVEQQIRVASGERLPIEQHDVVLTGHAIECRLNAEDPALDFRPSPGRITGWAVPGGPGIRVDTHCYAGYDFPPYYDSLMGKVIAHGADRSEAICRLDQALSMLVVEGVSTTRNLHRWILGSRDFIDDEQTTGWLSTLDPGNLPLLEENRA